MRRLVQWSMLSGLALLVLVGGALSWRLASGHGAGVRTARLAQAIAAADRVEVCEEDVGRWEGDLWERGDDVVLELRAAEQISELRACLAVEDPWPGEPTGGCPCIGWPGLRFYAGDRELAHVVVHHESLYWSGWAGQIHMTPEGEAALTRWCQANLPEPTGP